MLCVCTHGCYVCPPRSDKQAFLTLIEKREKMALEELQNGRYQRLRSLGSGGMGEVYLMQDTRVNRQVAIKVIRSEASFYPDDETAIDAARLFQREARAIAALEHPNILPLYDFGEETLEGLTVTYMVMPFCAEGSLKSWLRQSGNAPTLSLQDVAYLVEQAAEALQYAHDHQVIHLDVKSSNFLLRSNKKNPNRPTLLLADFGIARSGATGTNSSLTIRGTPTSMAPEQWSSQPVPATDQYALAVMTYKLLTGRPPFVGSLEQLMYQHFNTPPAPPSAFNTYLPAAVDSVLLRALAKKPGDRFPSITAFASAFEQAVCLSSAELTIGRHMPGLSNSAVDIPTTLVVSQAEAQTGINRMIALPGGKQVAVAVPAGVSDGHVIRLPAPVDSDAPASTVILTIAIERPEAEVPPSSDALVNAQPTLYTSQPDVEQSFDPGSDHNLPTIASSTSGLQAPEKQQPLSPPKRRSVPLPRLVGIISGVIIVLLLISTVYFYTSHRAGVNTLAHSQTPTVALTPTATPQPGLYIAGTYLGVMFDEITQQTTAFTLLMEQTRGYAPLSGSFVRESPQGQYPLKGTVDTHGKFSFTVKLSGGQTPLFFFGKVQQDVYLEGNFCSSNTNSCRANTGYFQAGPRY
jgi:serine/threonine protein kinase